MRWGPEAGESPGQPEQPRARTTREGAGKTALGGKGSGRDRGGLRHEVQDVGNFGDPHEVWISEWVGSPGRQDCRARRRESPASREEHPIFPGPGLPAKAGRPGTRPADRYGEAPRWTRPASRVQRGCRRAVSPREDSPRQCRDGRGDEQS